MNLFQFAKMPFSFQDGWNQVNLDRPSVLKTFFFLALPFSMIPALMLMYAGDHHAAAYRMSANPARWYAVAQIFFVAELVTIALMGALIRQVAATRKIAVNFERAFLLAAFTAIPMCLSSLGLAIPDMWAMIGIVVLGLLVAASLLYRGCYRILQMNEPMEAQSLSAEVFAGGGVAWALLCGFVLLPLMT